METEGIERVVLLALDALDYYLVNKWRLIHLKQEIHGKFEIDKRYYHWREPVPFSPTIWCTIATGEPPEAHGVRDWWRYSGFLEKLRFLPLIRSIRGKRKILWKLGVKPKIVDREVVGNTIFDRIPDSRAVYFPCYNDSSELHERLSRAIYKGIKTYIDEVWKVHYIRREALLDALGGKWRLLAAYFDIADLLGHACFKRCRLQLLKAYLDLNAIVAKVRKLVGEDTLVIVVSDHGMALSEDGVSGSHTGYAFWSLSRDLKLRINDFLDIPNLIENILMEKPSRKTRS